MDNNFLFIRRRINIVKDSLRESNDGHRRAVMVNFNNKIKRKKKKEKERDRKREKEKLFREENFIEKFVKVRIFKELFVRYCCIV